MANVMRLKIQKSNNGDSICAWMDNGEVEVFPLNSVTQEIVNRFASGELSPDEVVAKCAELTDITAAKAAAETAIRTRLEKVSERISTDGMHVYYDCSPFDKLQLDPALEEHIIRLMNERDMSEAAMHDWKCMAAFTENLYANVEPYIREQLFSWLSRQGWLTFTDDGCFIGYKGCRKNPDTGVAESIHTGPGMVNGVIYNGHIPNPDGAIVEMARDKVENNPSVGCASGMHVGTYDYASGFGQGILLRVKVNPRDVVSVPTECNAQKIRCCRYEVLDHEEYEYSVDYDRDMMSWGSWDDDWEYDEEDFANQFCDDWDPDCDCPNVGGYECGYRYHDDISCCYDCSYYEELESEYIKDKMAEQAAESDDCSHCDTCDSCNWMCDGICGDEDDGYADDEDAAEFPETASDFFGAPAAPETPESVKEAMTEGVASIPATDVNDATAEILNSFANSLGVSITINGNADKDGDEDAGTVVPIA